MSVPESSKFEHLDSPAPAPRHDPYAALRNASFRRFVVGNTLFVLAYQMQTLAVAWEVYERTGSSFALGSVGLIEFLPVLCFGLVAGQAADRFDRRRMLMACVAVVTCGALGLALSTRLAWPVEALYGCVFLIGLGRAFQQPTKAALLPQIVPPEQFPSAVTWAASSFHLATVVGPGLGGLLIAWWGGTERVYLLNAGLALVFLLLLVGVRHRGHVPSTEAITWRSLAAGAGFIWKQPAMFGAITLDLFAVLLGGATTLLPIYAKDLLGVGADGLGWLRAALGIGALAMALWLAHRPPLAHAGRALLWSVAGFGVATIVFGLSRSYALSLAMLFLTGALDNVSVVVRQTLIQLLTPDQMRGRVAAVNSMFIGASNELGGFESGLLAALSTPTISVVAGGVGTLAVVLAVARWLPEVGRYGRLGGPPAG